MKADVVLYDLNTTSFIPRGELPIHLVYAEHGQSIRKVFINGQLVVAEGRVLTVDESALLGELQGLQEYEPERALLYQQAERLMPAMTATYQRAMAQPLAIERFTRIEGG